MGVSPPPPPTRLGEKITSDVVVRVRTEGGREEWFYCHSDVLARKSKYLADRLLHLSPEMRLDSRACVDLRCHERDLDFYVCALRLLYSDDHIPTSFPNVRSALGILRVAIDLECQQLADSCLGFLEASPWEEAEEEEILRIVPGLGSQYQSILARLQPLDSSSIAGMFISALHFATSCPPCMQVLKSSVQEQLEYMLTEDDEDAPLLNSTDLFQTEASKCIGNLTSQFDGLFGFWKNRPANEATLEGDKLDALKYFLADFSWVCRILARIELMRDVVYFWVDVSAVVVEMVKHVDVGNLPAVKLKVVDAASKVLEAIGYGNVIIPTVKRVEMVKLWLPFVREAKEFADCFDSSEEDDTLVKIEREDDTLVKIVREDDTLVKIEREDDTLVKIEREDDSLVKIEREDDTLVKIKQADDTPVKIDEEIWHSIESAFVSMILALPSGDQAVILSDWLKDAHIRYPDLSEAFEVWCYRHKLAKVRMKALDGPNRIL